MADTKISALAAVTTPADTDEFAVNQGAASKKETRAQILTDVKLAQSLAFTGDLTPAQITAAQNDYDPANLATASVLRLDLNQTWKVTGLAGGADGRILVLYNISAGIDADLILVAESASSTAANRFAFGNDKIIEPGSSMTLIYDSTASRWRAIHDRRFTGSLYRLTPFYVADFLGAAGAAAVEAVTPWDTVLLASGTQAKIAGEQNHPGILRFSSSTTTNSGGKITTDVAALTLAGGGLIAEFVFQHRVASGTNTTIRMGFFDTATSADAVDGAYIEIPSGSLAAVGKTANNSARTTSATIATLSVNTWYRARVVVNVGATAVDFYIFDDAGNLLGSQQNTTNIPTAAGRETGHGVVATNVGTSAILLIYIDYMSLEWVRALI